MFFLHISFSDIGIFTASCSLVLVGVHVLGVQYSAGIGMAQGPTLGKLSPVQIAPPMGTTVATATILSGRHITTALCLVTMRRQLSSPRTRVCVCL